MMGEERTLTKKARIYRDSYAELFKKPKVDMQKTWFKVGGQLDDGLPEDKLFAIYAKLKYAFQK